MKSLGYFERGCFPFQRRVGARVHARGDHPFGGDSHGLDPAAGAGNARQPQHRAHDRLSAGLELTQLQQGGEGLPELVVREGERVAVDGLVHVETQLRPALAVSSSSIPVCGSDPYPRRNRYSAGRSSAAPALW